ncbi:MAG: DUF3999 family protein [Candidatus Tectimicrobiota bacterium]
MSRLTGWWVACCLVLGGMMSGGGHAAVLTDFRVFAPVTGEWSSETPVRLHLPREILAEARPGFADVRLFDDQGLEIPYAIYPQSLPASQTVVLQVLAYSQEQEGESIVLKRPTPTGAVRELLLQTSARDFHKTVRLQSSYDQVTWSEVTSAALFDFSSRLDLRQTTFPCPPVEAPYLRLLLKDVAPPRPEPGGLQLRYNGLELLTQGTAARPFRIEQISARLGPPQAMDDLYDQALLTSPEIRSASPGQSWCVLGRLNLPLAQLTLQIENSYYHRRVEVWSAEREQEDAYQQRAHGVIYKLPGVATAETALHVPPGLAPYVRLKIVNGDNPPLRLQAVELTWVRHYLYFVPAAGRRYTLVVGNTRVQPPVYELHHLLPTQSAARAQYPVVALGALQPQARYRPALAPGVASRTATVLVTLLVLFLATGLGWWAYRLLKVVGKPGQEKT